MKLLGYARVSSQGQAVRDTIEKQVYDIEECCKTNGHTLLAMFKEEAVSGTTDLDDRPKFIELMDRLENGNGDADGIIMYSLDRFARNSLVQEKFIVDFEKNYPTKKILTVVSGEVTGDDPERVLQRQILAAISQYERSNIARRLKGGKLRNIRNGKWNGGFVPLGFTLKKGKLIRDEQSMKLVNDIFKMRNKQGMSYRKIADELTNAKIPVPTPKTGRRKWRDWSFSTVRNILQNKLYLKEDSPKKAALKIRRKGKG